MVRWSREGFPLRSSTDITAPLLILFLLSATSGRTVQTRCRRVLRTLLVGYILGKRCVLSEWLLPLCLGICSIVRSKEMEKTSGGGWTWMGGWVEHQGEGVFEEQGSKVVTREAKCGAKVTSVITKKLNCKLMYQKESSGKFEKHINKWDSLFLQPTPFRCC